MAQIYIARSTGIGAFERHVVIKMILPERAHDHTSVQMFLDEARLAASLNHQNVAQVFEVGQDDGMHYLAMEYVHGQDLRALLAKAGSEGTRVPLELALTVVAGAAAGLHHAHDRRTNDGIPMGIVHRDVSPSNIMVGYDGAVKLLDFGIAKATMRSVETQSGIIKGKFAYMSPEQCRGRDVDRRSDVFSLGIILYEVTTQHRCFRADSDFDTMHRIVTGDVVRPTRLVLGYPPALEAIVMKALAVDPNERYDSAGALLEAVEAFSIAARMSLSMMSLGRFMRDMFGDVQEPWLVPGRFDPPPPREQTISNTNASGRHADDLPRYPGDLGEAPLHLPPGSTQLINVPRAQGLPSLEDMPSEVASWSVQPYPTALPPAYEHLGYNPSATPPELYDPRRMSSPNLPPMMPQIPSSTRPAGSQPALPLGFATQTGTGSSSGPAHPSYSGHLAQAQAHSELSQPMYGQPPAMSPYGGAPTGSQPIARTRQGYSGAPGQSESSYPRYEPQPGLDRDDDVSIHSGKRILYLGLGIVAVGLLIVLMWHRRSEDDPVTPGTQPATGSGVATGQPARHDLNPPPVPPESFSATDPKHPTAAPLPPTVPSTQDAKPPPLSDEITVHVVSAPPGADVLLGGYAIGKTPLDTHMKRGTGSATLTIHHDKFEDATTTIDLSGNYSRELTLTPVADEPAGGKDPGGKAGGRDPRTQDSRPAGGGKIDHGNNTGSGHPSGGGNSHPRGVEPKAPPAVVQCQEPSKFNPFDTACNGEPCPPCK